MALIHWKQIDGDLTSARVLTGSLQISGSIDVEALNGVNSFTGSSDISGSIQLTGSYSQISGSFTTNLTIDGEDFSVKSDNELVFKASRNRVVSFGEQATTPTAVSGGLFYSGSDEFFLGFKN